MPENIDVENRTSYHAPVTPEREAAHANVRSGVATLMQQFIDLPACRERSLAITRLEEAMFWANAAIARQAD